MTRAGTTGRAVVPLVFDNALAIVDAETGVVAAQVKTGGVAPFGSVISRDGRTAWVTNWGGRWPKDGDPTLPTGLDPKADRVVVDSRGIASTGTVVRVDLDAQKVTHAIDVGLHPTAVAWDEPRQRLYVANANSDSLTIVDTAQPRVAATLALKPFGLELKGVAPSALCVSPDGRRVCRTRWAECGGGHRRGTARGTRIHSTARYPNHLSLSRDGLRLAIQRCSASARGGRMRRRAAMCTRIAER